MPSLFALFRPPKGRARPGSPSRHTWPPRLRRAVAIAAESQTTTITEELQGLQGDPSGGNEDTIVQQAEVEASQESTSHADKDTNASPTVIRVKSNDGSDRSRSQKGSHRLKGLLARLRRPHDQSSVSEGPAIPQVLPTIPDNKTTTDPVKKNPPSDEQPALERENLEQRNVSAQTMQSQESNQTTATVNRRPSQRIPMPINELQEDNEYWSSIFQFEQEEEVGHHPEPSDPFSDGKNFDPQHQALPSSKHSEDQSNLSQRQSVTSQAISQAESIRHKSSKSSKSTKSRSNAQPTASFRTSRNSSISSHASRGSRFNKLDPYKAAKGFNSLASQLNLVIHIPQDKLEVAMERNSDDDDDRGRRRFSLHPRQAPAGHVRTTKSHITLGETQPNPAPRLRRTKTFANLRFRQQPMSSLRGKTVETLARLGGHTYLMLPADLAPAPLMLPACIVAAVIYLRKNTPHSAELFVEPGNTKAAIRLYDYFARQVLLAEKDAAKIAITTRVIAMPNLEQESDATRVLSVGWVFKELLAGLPGGILGSTCLYKILSVISLAPPVNPNCARLITLAIIALTSEMQCALICAVFGFFTSLLQEAEVSRFSQLREERTGSGMAARPVASTLSTDALARVFGPLLIGGHDRDRATQVTVEQEVEEQRVVGLLLANWRNISRQLRECTGNSPGSGKRE